MARGSRCTTWSWACWYVAGSMLLAVGRVAPAGVAFYVEPDGQMAGALPTRDLAFQHALGAPFREFDLHQFTGGYVFDTQPPGLTDGSVFVRPQLFTAAGAPAGDPATNGGRLVEIYPLPTVAGIIEAESLLNRTVTAGGGQVVGAAIRFSFSAPVNGFGAWVVDDFVIPSRLVLTVTEASGATFTSPALESGNGATLAVEGFIGAVSNLGIISATIQQQTLAGTPTDGDFFYLDHLQLGGRMPLENCGNAVDDNADGLADCADPQCRDDPQNPACGEGTCDDGLDNEGDGQADCADSDCFGLVGCTSETLWCGDGQDNDADGAADCADADCGYVEACPEICTNGVDDNANGVVDCAELQCFSDPACPSICESINPALLKDACVDSGCSGLPACGAGPGPAFFVHPDGRLSAADASLDLAFQAALTAGLTELDLHEYGHGYVTELSPPAAGAVTVRPILLDASGSPAADTLLNGGRLIETYPFVPVVPGILGGGADGATLLNRVYAGGGADVVGPAVEFTFSHPVEAFGLWILEDFPQANRFVLRVVELGGTVYTSPPLESGNGASLAIEGFIGAVSEVGITKVVVEQQTLTGTPTGDDFFYLDHLQIGGRFPALAVCNDPFADVDADQDVDMDDFAVFQRCYTAKPTSLKQSCACLDRNGDYDVDAEDLESFTNCAGGPGVAADQNCD